ncbi:MAG: N-acetylmuramate alpha-1-phosphate uridylyltransferase MurU [Acidiferrobacterales bacterium]
MKAFILAAGRGERMRPLTDSIPKPLLTVGGEPLIVHTIRRLSAAGVSDLVVNVSHLADQIEAFLGNGAQWGVNINYSHEEAALETAGGIINALPLLGDSPFILVNGDIWTDYDFSGLTKRPLENSLAHLVMVSNPGHHPQGDFYLDHGKLGQEGGEALTYSGIGLYSPALFSSLPPGKRPLAPILRQAISNSQLSGEKFNGKWMDVGTPERLSELDSYLDS